jgi:hypothetical protein
MMLPCDRLAIAIAGSKLRHQLARQSCRWRVDKHDDRLSAPEATNRRHSGYRARRSPGDHACGQADAERQGEDPDDSGSKSPTEAIAARIA